MVYTNLQDVKDVIADIADAFTIAFPNRIDAIYAEGSYAADYVVPGSDLDLVIILGDVVSEKDRQMALELTANLDQSSPMELDLELVCRNQKVRPALKLNSVLVYGDEVRDQLAVMSIREWIRERMYAGSWLICHLFGRPGVAKVPMDFPNASGEFYGYNTNRGNNQGSEGTTKDLVRAISWAATALTARSSGQYLTSKADLLREHPEHLPHEWGAYLTSLFEYCRTNLNYGVPDSKEGRGKLRGLCEKTREFETYFLAEHREFVLTELANDEGRCLEALEKLRETPFCDSSIRDHVKTKDWKDPDLERLQQDVLNAIDRQCCV